MSSCKTLIRNRAGFAFALAVAGLLPGCSALRPSRPAVFQMGEPAEVGKLIYTVLEAEWRNHLGEGAETRSPAHYFLLLRVSVTNSGAQEATIPATELVSSGGGSYPELSDGAGVPEWLGMLRPVAPAETAQGRLLFDAPRGDYSLRVSDAATGLEQAKVALIEVPLRFESRAPSIPLPGQDSIPAR